MWFLSPNWTQTDEHETVPLRSLTVGRIIDKGLKCCAPWHWEVFFPANGTAWQWQEGRLVLGCCRLLWWATLAQGFSVERLRCSLRFFPPNLPSLPIFSTAVRLALWPLPVPSLFPLKSIFPINLSQIESHLEICFLEDPDRIMVGIK